MKPAACTVVLALALAVPAAAHASELTPEQMAWYRAQMGLASSSGPPPSTSSPTKPPDSDRASGAERGGRQAR